MFFNYHVENSQKIHAKVKHIYFHKYKLNVHFVRFLKKNCLKLNLSLQKEKQKNAINRQNEIN